MKTFILIITGCTLCLYGCSETINNSTASPPVYNEIITVSLPGDYVVKLYSADTDSLTYAYNEVYFKVWQNTAEQNTGYLKVYPTMRMTPHIVHSTPVSDSFAYDSRTGYYRGYMIFNMPTTPPNFVWNTRFTFADINNTFHERDSVPLYTSYRPERQLRYFYDLSDTAYYTLTLVKPFQPLAGINDLAFLLHRSDVYEMEFEQLRNSFMHINVYKEDSLYSTSGNSDPVISSDGIYRGRINVPHKGRWITGDTIYYNGRIITNNPPPLPEFYIEIK
jgi:hypothetical protein